MKKFILTVSLLLSIILIILIFAKLSVKPVFTFDENKFYAKEIDNAKTVYKVTNKIDSIFDTGIAFEIIKNQVICDICRINKIDLSDSVLTGYAKMISEDARYSDLTGKLNNKLKHSDYLRFFIKPFIAANLISDFILYDSTGIQKNRYDYMKKICSEWDGIYVDKSFLNQYTDYFEKSLESDDSLNFSQTNSTKSNSFEDEKYYYSAKIVDNRAFGYRIEKISFDDYVTGLNKTYNVHFYDKSFERAFKMLSDSTLFEKIIIIK